MERESSQESFVAAEGRDEWALGRGKGETDDSDGLHVAVRKGEETLSGESHVALPFAIVGVLVALLVLEFVPERLGGEAGTGGSAGEGKEEK